VAARVLTATTHDRAETARRTLNRDGLTITRPRGELKPYLCVLIARDCTALYAKLVAQLGLDQDDEDDAAPKVDRRYRMHKHAPPAPGRRARR
jgi:hypothetical protein